jgi:hypothetical protein
MASLFQGIDVNARNNQIKEIVDKLPLENERITCFYKDTEEIRADLELGGLGPGLTGEHTVYHFVVARRDDPFDENEEDEIEDLDKKPDASKHMRRWVIKKRYSHFHIFDKVLLQIIMEEGGDESWLPELPEKQLFGKMSPSLVKERATGIEHYLKEITKNENLLRIPFVRQFLKIPMTMEEVKELDEEFANQTPGMLSGNGEFKSLFQLTREQKAKGKHHTQKKETFAGPPTLAGASEVGEAFSNSSVHDKKADNKWVFRIPILADFGGQRVGDIFGDEVRGLHSTYNEKIKKQVEKSSKEKRQKKCGKEYFITSDGYDQDGNFVG